MCSSVERLKEAKNELQKRIETYELEKMNGMEDVRYAGKQASHDGPRKMSKASFS